MCTDEQFLNDTVFRKVNSHTIFRKERNFPQLSVHTEVDQVRRALEEKNIATSLCSVILDTRYPISPRSQVSAGFTDNFRSVPPTYSFVISSYSRLLTALREQRFSDWCAGDRERAKNIDR